VWGLAFPSYRQTNNIFIFNLMAMNSFIHATQKKKRTDNFCLWVGESNQVKVNIKEAGLLAMSGSYFQIIGFGIQIVIF
jgi:hypothetical protein